MQSAQLFQFAPKLELRLADYKLSGGSIACEPGMTTFAFTIGPLSDETLAALDRVARSRGTICLRSDRQPMFFDLITIERKDRTKTRLVGRLVDTLRE